VPPSGAYQSHPATGTAERHTQRRLRDARERPLLDTREVADRDSPDPALAQERWTVRFDPSSDGALDVAGAINCFNARSDHTSAFHRLFTNRYLWGAIALSALLQLAVVQVSFLNSAFDTTPLGVDDWLICLGLASVVVWADEAKKLVRRRLLRAARADEACEPRRQPRRQLNGTVTHPGSRR
jgi:hypothetical protein